MISNTQDTAGDTPITERRLPGHRGHTRDYTTHAPIYSDGKQRPCN